MLDGFPYSTMLPECGEDAHTTNIPAYEHAVAEVRAYKALEPLQGLSVPWSYGAVKASAILRRIIRFIDVYRHRTQFQDDRGRTVYATVTEYLSPERWTVFEDIFPQTTEKGILSKAQHDLAVKLVGLSEECDHFWLNRFT
jgi:hypothetical protein